MKISNIKDIKILNYKGIDNLEFSPKNINIIVGPNNTGKSSLINAIQLFLVSLNGFKRSQTFDPSIIIPKNRIIYEVNTNLGEISMNVESLDKILDKFKLEIRYSEEIPREYINATSFEKFENFRIQRRIDRDTAEYKEKIQAMDSKSDVFTFTTSTLVESDILTTSETNNYYENRIAEITQDIIKANENSGNDTLYFKLLIDKKIILESYLNTAYYKFKGTKSQMSSIEFRNYFEQKEKLEEIENRINSKFLCKPQSKNINLIDYFRTLSRSPSFYEILDIIKHNLYYVYDIREIDGEINVIIQGSNNRKILIPLNLMGDGFQSLFLYYVLFEVYGESIILLEEPENSLHPGYMALLANTIISKCSNQQYFFSTHSLELIKHIINKAKETNNLDKILILRLSRRNNKIDREILKNDDILEEIENLEIDLRGY